MRIEGAGAARSTMRGPIAPSRERSPSMVRHDPADMKPSIISSACVPATIANHGQDYQYRLRPTPFSISIKPNDISTVRGEFGRRLMETCRLYRALHPQHSRPSTKSEAALIAPPRSFISA